VGRGRPREVRGGRDLCLVIDDLALLSTVHCHNSAQKVNSEL